MSELTTNINRNNNNLQYDELIGSLVLHKGLHVTEMLNKFVTLGH